MKLAIVHDDGDLEVVVDGIESYDFLNPPDRREVINAIERVLGKIEAFRAASPKPELED